MSNKVLIPVCVAAFMTSVFRCVLEQICILDFRMKSLHVLAVCCCFLPGLAVFANDVYVPVELQEWE